VDGGTDIRTKAKGEISMEIVMEILYLVSIKGEGQTYSTTD